MKLDGTWYYEYALCYVDDVMVISANLDAVIKELQEHFVLKEVTDPGKSQCYLGAVIGRYPFKDGSLAWYMSASRGIPQLSNPNCGSRVGGEVV